MSGGDRARFTRQPPNPSSYFCCLYVVGIYIICTSTIFLVSYSYGVALYLLTVNYIVLSALRVSTMHLD